MDDGNNGLGVRLAQHCSKILRSYLQCREIGYVYASLEQCGGSAKPLIGFGGNGTARQIRHGLNKTTRLHL
jgi:hypothetical protein